MFEDKFYLFHIYGTIFYQLFVKFLLYKNRTILNNFTWISFLYVI